MLETRGNSIEKLSKLHRLGTLARQEKAVPNGGKKGIRCSFSAITAIFGLVLLVKTVVKLQQIPGETPFFAPLPLEGHP